MLIASSSFGGACAKAVVGMLLGACFDPRSGSVQLHLAINGTDSVNQASIQIETSTLWVDFLSLSYHTSYMYASGT